jgi:FtsP/CotA-like multicopper oxidase with cupredoxin domain
MSLARRRFLQLSLAAAAALPLGCTVGRRTDTVGRVAFDRPLAIPPLAPSRLDGEGRRTFDLTAQAGHREFRPRRRTDTWGFNGDYLGPTLRARRGEQVAVNVHNRLDETTTVHWHGMHLAARADGGPHQPIAPGRTWSPSWLVDQPATTLWYHPHPHGATERHVYRGLAGMFIVDDDAGSALRLPRTYGVDDIPLIVQDKRFRRDGRFDESDHGVIGLLGDTLLVNGTLSPYHDVNTERVRLRLLNGSTGRIYSFGLADERPFAIVGTDGGLLAAPVRADRVQLSPGERAEVVVGVRPGERVVLRSFPPDLGTNPGISELAGGEDRFDVLELRAASALRASPELPLRLVDLAPLRADGVARIRLFRMAGRRINGKRMDMDRIDELVTRDTTEIWQVTNQHEQPHNFHVHGVQFQILTIDDAAPPPWLAGWKDTVYLPPQVPIRLIMRFSGYADPAMPYMYHCHLLLHEDSGMMGQFVVVEPGQAAGVPPAHHH